tara:strand:+ start:218 stop:850 length:633 start_codon:yes stop_codon:yes gene_type:complete
MLLKRASGDTENMWKSSALIGICQTLFDAIFRISLLRRQLPLTDFDQLYAQELKENVLQWRWDSTEENAPEYRRQDSRPPDAMVRTGHMYQLACLLLVEKILAPDLAAHHQVPRNLIVQFCHIFRQLSPELAKHSVHLWPLLIMGTAAQTRSERELFLAPLQSHQTTPGFGNRHQGCTFLMRCWGLSKSSDEALGLDVLLRDDLLCEIFI